MLFRSELLKKHPNTTVFIPVTEDTTFVESVVKTVQANKSPYQIYFSAASEFTDSLTLEAMDIVVCGNPVREILREVTPDDILALVWDDSVEAHMTLHSVEDYGLEAWDISDGLDPIEVDHSDSDDLYSEMQEKLHDFIEVFAAYMTASIMDSMAKTIDSLIAEQMDLPFDEE